MASKPEAQPLQAPIIAARREPSAVTTSFQRFFGHLFDGGIEVPKGVGMVGVAMSPDTATAFVRVAELEKETAIVTDAGATRRAEINYQQTLAVEAHATKRVIGLNLVQVVGLAFVGYFIARHHPGEGMGIGVAFGAVFGLPAVARIVETIQEGVLEWKKTPKA